MVEVTRTVVSGNLGDFKMGDVLVAREEIAKYYRTAAMESAMGDDDEKLIEGLTDDEVLKVIDNVDTSEFSPNSDTYDEDVDVARSVALEKYIDSKKSIP